MNLLELVKELHRLDIRLFMDEKGHGLWCSTPRNVVMPESLRLCIKRHKDAIRDIVEQQKGRKPHKPTPRISTEQPTV